MRVEKNMENLCSCLCLECPSYTKGCKNKHKIDDFSDVLINDKEHLEIMFCAFDKCDCIKENNGCLCGQCRVHKKYNLNNEDYCIYSGGVF